jgi:glucosamine-6-phosphate deaminase
MKLVILEDYDKASLWAAKYIKKRIHDFKPGPDKYFVLGLPTGTTYMYIEDRLEL